MAASCRYLADPGVVESVYSGRVGPDEQRRAMLQAIDLARGSGCFRFLSDLSGLSRGPTPADLMATIEALGNLGLPRSLREALVLPRGEPVVEDVRFYEDACRNRGWNVRVFRDRESALAWLHSAGG